MITARHILNISILLKSRNYPDVECIFYLKRVIVVPLHLLITLGIITLNFSVCVIVLDLVPLYTSLTCILMYQYHENITYFLLHYTYYPCVLFQVYSYVKPPFLRNYMFLSILYIYFFSSHLWTTFYFVVLCCDITTNKSVGRNNNNNWRYIWWWFGLSMSCIWWVTIWIFLFFSEISTEDVFLGYIWWRNTRRY